jgi:hypothetical protein
MAKKYELVGSVMPRTRKCSIASATEIAAGDLVAISSGLIIKAVTASTMIAWTPQGSADGDTVIEVTEGNDFTLKGPGESAFAIAYKGVEYDINNDGTQTIDYNGTTYKVLKVSIDESAGVVGTATGVEVRINKPIF